MSRKVTVELKIKLDIVVDEGMEISQLVDELDYNFEDTTGYADIKDMEIMDFEITDSR